jgi:ElaB/YqjD/DUF883 family membrane-anchored ribosome-binding protein
MEMRHGSVDGNLAALRRYEREQEKQEAELDQVMDEIQPLLDQITELADECKSYAQIGIHDFTNEIDQALKDSI